MPSPSPPRSAAPPTPSFWPGRTDSVFPASRWCKENLRHLKAKFLVLRSIGHRKLIPGSGRQAPADNHNLESAEVSDPQLSAKRVTPVRSVCGCGRQPGSGRRRVSLHVPRLGGSTRVARRAPQPTVLLSPRGARSLGIWTPLRGVTRSQNGARSSAGQAPELRHGHAVWGCVSPAARPGPPPACQGDRPPPPASWLGCRAGAQEASISGGDPHQRQQEPSLSSDPPQGELSQGAKGDSGEVSKGTRGFADRT